MTKDKIRFLDGNANAKDLVPASQLQLLFGGDVDFVYVRPSRFPSLAVLADRIHQSQDHKTYWPALVQLCDERKAANLDRWRKYGDGKCGLSEAVIRGAITPGAEAPEPATESTTSTIVAGDAEKAAVSPTLSTDEGEFVDAEVAGVDDLEKAVKSVSLESLGVPALVA
mgnify:CR=1 FL=1